MLDPRLLRGETETVAKALNSRGYVLDVTRYRQQDERRRELQIVVQDLQNERNTRSKSIGKAKAAGEDIQPLLNAVADLGEKLDGAKAELDAAQAALADWHLQMPNLPDSWRTGGRG